MIPGIEIDMYKEITVLDMATVATIPGRWLRRGPKKNTEILRGKIYNSLLVCAAGFMSTVLAALLLHVEFLF